MKRKLLLGLGIVTAFTGASFAVAATSPQATEADEKPPIVTQVEEHEVRITDLEDRADVTEQDVAENTAAITKRIVVQHEAPASQPTSEPASQSADEPEQEPAPEPEPVHPRTITAVVDEPKGELHSCRYTLHDPLESSKQGVVIQPAAMPCMNVGEILPKL